jgi:hypothetical protein
MHMNEAKIQAINISSFNPLSDIRNAMDGAGRDRNGHTRKPKQTLF